MCVGGIIHAFTSKAQTDVCVLRIAGSHSHVLPVYNHVVSVQS